MFNIKIIVKICTRVEHQWRANQNKSYKKSSQTFVMFWKWANATTSKEQCSVKIGIHDNRLQRNSQFPIAGFALNKYKLAASSFKFHQYLIYPIPNC